MPALIATGDKPAQWAASAIESWYGPKRKGFQRYVEAFSSTWTDLPDAGTLLSSVASDAAAPAFVRASALTELASWISSSNINLARSGLADPDPMVRIGALEMLANVPASQIWPVVSPLLYDSNRGVRIRAAALLAPVPTANQPPADRERFDRASDEFIAAQHLNADRPEARSALGIFYARRGLTGEAEAEFKAGLELSPQYAPAAINLADLYRQLGRDAEGESVLHSAIAASPQDGGVHHALGLTLTRLKRPDEALEELRRATELEPERARYAYVYAVALHSAQKRDQAINILREILVRHPANRDALLAMASFARDGGDLETALEYTQRLASLAPDDPRLAAFIEDIRRQLKKPDGR